MIVNQRRKNFAFKAKKKGKYFSARGLCFF